MEMRQVTIRCPRLRPDFRHSFARLCLTTLALMAGTLTVSADDAATVFRQQIQPILQSRCTRCHGETKQSADLNLASEGALWRGGESGSVLVPGKPEESLLLEMIDGGQMPPAGNAPVTAAEREILRRWISTMPERSHPNGTVTDQQMIPLLLLRCSACHGGRRREADLDLRTRAGILKGGKSGPAALPGNPAESLLIRRIHAEEMPPRRQLVSVSVKPMEAAELARLMAWIAAGLPESRVAPDVASADKPDRLVTDDDRQFWSFQTPHAHPPPDVRRTAASEPMRTPIDPFVLSRLQERGLEFSPEADRGTLLRRITFDLIGLPPSPDEIALFLNDDDPTAFEKVVDRLLASPHYGERWGRHWLDVAGYADSEGAQNEDRVRPNMWRYRDYVIRSWNADKPFRRFLEEQIAGDELADYERAPEITAELYDNLVATGFLRTAPDRTFANITNFVPDRLEVIADEIQILGSAVLGLTLHCARCHSHKFDPIPQRDYYRIAASLKDALDEHDWLGPEVRQLNFVTTAERRDWEASERLLADEIATVRSRIEAASDDAARKSLQEQIRNLEGRKRPEPRIRALWSRGDPSPTYVLQRGNALTPGSEVGPGVLSILTDGKTAFAVEPPYAGARTTGRRLALARWLTDPDHPLTARVFVNRVWKQHFGKGLVTTLANFGRTGAPPSHPELLDWLARDFPRHDWSIKSLHRLLVSSRAYRQVSQSSESARAADPDNRWLSRMPLRRLEAEGIRDALLTVAGVLNDTPFGPPVDVDVRGDGLVTVRRTGAGDRRSVYVLHRRTRLPTILESFDSPQMGPNCVERAASIVAPQALHLMNNAQVHELTDLFAQRVLAEVGTEPERQVDRIYELAFGRSPDTDERQLAVDLLRQLRQEWIDAAADDAGRNQAPVRALANLCHAVVNLAGFVFVD